MKKFFYPIIIITLNTVFLFSQIPGWEIINSGTTENLNSIHFWNLETGFACGDNGTVLKSIDSGKTWQSVATPTSENLDDIFQFDSNVIIAIGDAGLIIRTTDGGLNWNTISSGLTDNLYSISFIDSFGICGAGSQSILYSTNSGADWMEAQSGFFGGGFWGATMLSQDFGFVVGENSIFQPLLGVSTDGGENWNFSAFYLNGNEGRATGVDFTDLFTGYVSSSVWDGRGAISKTTDTGTNWVTQFFNDPLNGIDFPISGASQVGYCVGDLGQIYKTYDAGTSWQQQQSGTTNNLNKVFFVDLDYGFAVGSNGTILKTVTGGEPVTSNNDKANVITEFKLEQNYPNPFNPSTKIKFQIPQDVGGETRDVILKVYDVLGNEVTTLINEQLSAGEYEVKFNASALPSGIYFYQLKAGSYVETKKMLLLK